jgi:plastocyanin
VRRTVTIPARSVGYGAGRTGDRTPGEEVVTMASTPITATPTGLAVRSSLTLTWTHLLRLAALTEGLLLLVAAWVLGDPEALAFGVASLLTFGLLRWRSGHVGAVLHALLFVDVAGWMLPGAVINLVNGAGVPALVFPAALGLTSLVGLVAAVGVVLRRAHPTADRTAARSVVFGAAAAFVLLLGAGALTDKVRLQRPPAGVVLETRNAAFSTNALVADGGQVTLRLANRDLFWHTFTIDALGVDLRVPVNGEQSVTFTAPPGTYAFYCAIPGHESIGMRGTLTVR